MPQNTQGTTPQPGSDVLLDTLRMSKVTDEQRQQIWDAYHAGNDEDSFVKSINTLSIADDAKQTLYEMRFKGFKNQPINQQAQAPTGVSTPRDTGPFSIGAYQARPGGPILNVHQSSINAAAQAVEKSIGITKPPSSLVDAFSQAGKSFGGMVSGEYKRLRTDLGGEATDPASSLAAGLITPFGVVASGIEGIASGLEEGGKDVYSGMKRNDPRQVATGTGSVASNLFMMSEAEKLAKTRALSTGPIEGGAIPKPGEFSYTPEVARSLQKMGFSNQELSSMNASQLQDALSGRLRPQPTPEAPAPRRASVPGGETIPSRPEQAVPGARASSNQSAAQPQTTQVSTVPTKAPEPTPAGPLGDFRGMTGPLRPYDPSGTRFAKGGTIGMDPLDLMA